MINPLPRHKPTLTETPPMTTYISETNREESPELGPNDTEDNNTSYDIVPRSEIASKADDRLHLVKGWLENLQQPEGLTDSEYKMFMWFCTEFFVTDN